MDPKANLDEQTRILARAAKANGRLDSYDLDRLGELIEALDEWFARGGFVPDGWSPLSLRAQRSDAIVAQRTAHERAGIGEF